MKNPLASDTDVILTLSKRQYDLIRHILHHPGVRDIVMENVADDNYSPAYEDELDLIKEVIPDIETKDMDQ